jgi:hypothetical protein
MILGAVLPFVMTTITTRGCIVTLVTFHDYLGLYCAVSCLEAVLCASATFQIMFMAPATS